MTEHLNKSKMFVRSIKTGTTEKVNQMAKANVLKKSMSGTVLSLSFEQIGKKLDVDVSAFKPEIRAQAEQHGWLQRFGDLESGDKVGKLKFEACKALAEHLKAGGTWDMPRDVDTTAIVIEAVHRCKPKYSVEMLMKAVEKKPEQVADWRANAEVKSMIAKIRAEKAAAAAKVAEKQEITIEV